MAALALLGLLLMGSEVTAQTTNKAAANAELQLNLRELRLNAFEPSGPTFEYKSLPNGEPPCNPTNLLWTASIGAAYTDAESGTKTGSVPYNVKAQIGDNSLSLTSPNGYSHVSSDGSSKSGVGDPTIQAAHQWNLECKVSTLIGSVGATIPAGGEVGSTNAKQRAGLSYARAFSAEWKVTLSGKIAHTTKMTDPGVSAITDTGLISVTYRLPDNPSMHQLQLQLGRSNQSGVGGSTQSAFTYNFPITASTLGGSLAYTRGLTAGTRDNTLEFDLVWQW
jgi:type II secretory pathway pseudopilin PulG